MRMKPNTVTHALILATHSNQHDLNHDRDYGGETLLNRSLVALSKSGITSVVIITEPGHRDIFESMIQLVKHRLALNFEIAELQSGQLLSDMIRHATASWNSGFLLYEMDHIMHPTLLQQAVTTDVSGRSVILGYKDVHIRDGQLYFSPGFKEKFKIIFENPGNFKKIILDPTDGPAFSSDSLDLSSQNRRLSFSESGNGVFCTDVLVCRKEHFSALSDFRSFDEAVAKLLTADSLKMQFVSEAWWLKITPDISKSHVREFFWKIAFKEISGEFSKAVNSKMSKPLSFFFARHGVTPNALSNAQLVLFLTASGFLLVDAHWATVLFACIWQFSAGVLDRCDGEVARIRNYESAAGGRYDMIIDDMRNVLPFLFLGGFLYTHTHNHVYAKACVLTLVWFVILTLYEQRLMAKAGYISRQRLYYDYLKLKGEHSQTTSLIKKYVPLISGDIRTFYVFLLALLGLKELVFYVLLAYLTVLPIYSVLGVLKFQKENSKKPIGR